MLPGVIRRVITPRPMAANTVFPSGVPQSERARDEIAERQKTAEALRAQLLDEEHTSEIYSEHQSSYADSSSLMPTPDIVARKFAGGKGYDIYPQMRRNVLKYGALQGGMADLLMLHRIVWLPGQKGDAASESAKEEMESAWSNLVTDGEVLTAMHAVVDDGAEAGFAGAENVWGVHTRGKAKDLIFPVAVINRPVSWFGFDWLNRPIFLPRYRRGAASTEPFSDYKVSFMRMGSIHTRYGRGTGQDCYPAVWLIDSHLKGYLQAAERFSYPLIAATYPEEWAGTKRQTDFEYNLYRTWKNFLSFPGGVDSPVIEIVGRGVAAGGFTGSSQMEIVHLLEGWISHYLTGGMLSNSNESVGSFARDKTHAGLMLDKINPRASAMEAFINRGITKPAMLVNHPELPESLWPRAQFDIAPNEDLAALRESVKQGVEMGFRVSRVWWSETFKIPEAREDEPSLDVAPTSGFDAAADAGSSVRAAARLMSEQDSVITIVNKDGHTIRFYPNETVATENRGWVRAASITSDDMLVVHKARVIGG